MSWQRLQRGDGDFGGGYDAWELAWQMGVSLEDAAALHAQAVAVAAGDGDRAWVAYVALLARATGATRTGAPGKQTRSARLGEAGGARPRRSSAPGKRTRTTSLASTRPPAAMALRTAEPTGAPEGDLASEPAPFEHALRWSRGTALPTEVRRLMERLLGDSFADVSIHVDRDASAAAAFVNARAFTVADRIFFKQGAYAPDSTEGRALLAHELTHVIQWQQGRVPTVAGHRVGDPGDPLEHEAETVARGVARPDAPAVAGANPTRSPSSSPVAGGPVLRAADPHASVDLIPPGGTPVDKVGIVAWDGAPALRLRSSPSTTADNVISELAFNTHLQVIKELPGKWYFVSTQNGQLGYVARDYVKTNLPEPNAKLHKVQAGLPGYAISIAEHYYKQYADDWGQDLRFYVNVIAWVNHRDVPDTASGWKDVHFKAGEFIWIPTHAFARTLRGVVNSGSISHNIAESVGIADFLDRVGELWDDIRAAIALSKKYIPAAIGRHVEAALWGVLESIAMMLVLAVAILAISTAIGAAIGGLAGAGAGAVPGAAAGFEIGMVLLESLGLGMLILWVGASVMKVAGAFGSFLGGVWNARGDQGKLELAARQFAEAIGTLCGVILEGLVMWAVSIGATKAIGALRGSRFGKSFNNSKTGEWLNERVRRVKAGETALPTPKDAIARMVRNTELVDGKNSPIGEFDGIDMGAKKFVENKSATGIDKPHPRTGKPQQTAADWAAKQVTKKTTRRIQALRDAAATRARPGTQGEVPSLAEIQGIRQIHFMIDGDAPALRAAVFAELATLRANNPGWSFTVEFGVTVVLPPIPGTGDPEN